MLFKNVDVIRYKERPRNCSKLKNTKCTWQLNTIHDSGFFGAKKDVLGIIGDI